MRFTVVTPCWNSAGLIGDTVRSLTRQTVLAQPHAELQYVVVDGASTDTTLAEVEEAWEPHARATLTVISEADAGMYDALVKGLRLAEGDVVSYLNAGDYYSPHCLAVVRACFELDEVSWLTGMRVLYGDDGTMISARLPYRYDRRLMAGGHYGVRGGRFLQQESTFWSVDLLRTVDLDRLATLRLAGDLFLWTQMARSADLDIVSAHLGGFRFHGDHLSEAMDAYRGEARGFLGSRQPLGGFRGLVHEVLSAVPASVRPRLPGRHPLIVWDRTHRAWRRVG